MRHGVTVLLAGMFLCLPFTAWAHKCDLTTSALDFGSYDTETSTPLDVAGSIGVSCRGNISTVLLRLSPGSGGNANNRQMVSTNGVLGYNLFTNPNRTRIWGDGSGGTDVVVRVGGRGRNDWDIPVYGRIFARQDPWPGDSVDNIVITVTF